MAARERGQRGEHARAEQDDRQDHHQQLRERPRRDLERHVEALDGHDGEGHTIRKQGHQQRGQREHGGRQDLPADQRATRYRRRKQGLERLAFALPRGRVDRELHAADEREQQQQVRQKLLREIESRLRRRHVALAELQRVRNAKDAHRAR